MLKAYKYRIYPNEEQKKHFVQAMGCVRYMYNKGLEVKIKHYEETGKTLTFFDLVGTLLKEEKKNNEWLSIPYSQSLQMPLRNLDNAFQRFFKKTSGFPTFKKKSNHQSIQYPQNVSIDFKANKVKIPKAGLVFCRFDRKFVGKIKTCTVSKTPTNKFYISILVDNDIPLPEKFKIKQTTSIGIDLGLTHFAISSDGGKIENPRHLNKLLARLKVLQKRASKKQKGSNNRKKANFAVAKLYEKITNQRNDFLHKLSTNLIRNNQTIILEDLNVKGMMKNHKLAKAIADVSWSRFVDFLKYKAEWNGNNIIQIGRFDPSSKMCSECGTINKNLSLKDRFWTCAACGGYHDRDINAAINIKKFGLIQAKSGQELPEELAEIPCRKKDRRSKKLLTIMMS
jgi:putative transposase